jgi:hypothetical protein
VVLQAPSTDPVDRRRGGRRDSLEAVFGASERFAFGIRMRPLVSFVGFRRVFSAVSVQVLARLH